MRRADWRERLRSELIVAAKNPFRYGRHDCAGFSVRCVTAISTLPPIVPHWENATTAAATIAAHGDLIGAVRHFAALNGWSELGPRFAMAGDLVFRADRGLLRTRFGGALGIVALDGRQAWFASDRGLAPVPISDFDAAWRT